MTPPTKAFATIAAIFTALTLSTTASAFVATFTEDFNADTANWTNGLSAPLTHVASGGPDGSGYASTSLNFLTFAEDDSAVAFRAESFTNPSGGAFFGDWTNPDVLTFSFAVRHNAPTPLTYFVRFASPFNFPGGIAVNFVPVFSNTWTEVSIDIDPSNPQFVSFEGMTFDDVFTNLGRIQIGVNTPAALANADTEITFDIDNATVAVPEPASISLLALTGLIAARRRRNHRAA